MKLPTQFAEIPPPSKILAAVFAALLFYTWLRFFAGGGEMPIFLPMVAALVSIGSLAGFGTFRDPAESFMRSGYHVGVFSFFLFYPLTDGGNVAASTPPSLRSLIGWMMVMTVVGFEIAYWGSRPTVRVHRFAPTPFVLSPKTRALVLRLVYVGVFTWFVTVFDIAFAAGVSTLDVLLAMRGRIGDSTDFVPILSGRLALVQRVLAGGVFLAATAGAVLVLLPGERRRSTTVICWTAMVVCAVTGFLSGTRSIFFYSFAPLAMTSWLTVSRSALTRRLRWVWAAGAFATLLVIWLAMSSFRDNNLRDYETRLESISEASFHARGALDIYSQLSVVVQSFPEVVPYQHGASLVPLVLGWVPRAAWPGKPYPFSLWMNFLNGETLEHRAASLAVGLPGEGYGNFGLVGVLLWALIMGFFCRRGDDTLGKMRPEHPLRMQLAAMCAIWAAMIVRGGVPEMFYMGLSVVMLPAALAVYLSRTEKQALEDQGRIHSHRSPSGPAPWSTVAVARGPMTNSLPLGSGGQPHSR